MIPAVITPYVIAAIGERQARRYCLTAEKFDAAEAFRLGLIHDLVEEHELGSTLNTMVTQLFLGGPQALAQCKDWIATAAASPIDEQLVAESARRIAALRASSEGRDGVAAFLEKRDARWVAEARLRMAARDAETPAAKAPGAEDDDEEGCEEDGAKTAAKKNAATPAASDRRAPARRR
jgi:hypothetical protein